MVEALPQRGVLRVVPPAQYEAQLQAGYNAQAKAEDEAVTASLPDMTQLGSYIRTQFSIMQNHRQSGSGWAMRLLKALRAFNGEYDPEKLREIQKFGGSTVYARMIAMKCRGASSLLRDVYLTSDRPWGIAPPADPDVPPEVTVAVQQLVMGEVESLVQGGMPIQPEQIRDRINQLMTAAKRAEKKNAAKRARIAEDKIDELLETGGFYKAFAEFLVDLPLFPFACLKGPVVRIVPNVAYINGKAQVEQKARLFWQRVSPFDLYWSPGVSDIEDASVIERTRVTRADLNDLMGLPGYDTDAIRGVLDDYGRGGLFDNWDTTDSERAVSENREDPHMNQSGIINCLEFTGSVQGRMLLDHGFTVNDIEDPLRDYSVQAWLIGRYVIKVQLSPSPRKRHPYFITSFEKVPGTPVGNGLPDILEDVGDVANATLRSLVNNLSISSGPQVVVNMDRIHQQEDPESLYPWKRWFVTGDPLNSNSSQKPIDFFQPMSNASELLAVYNQFQNIADELSAIPKYMAGGGGSGGAGRTAAGLAMLMGNASKILQTVAANVDRDVMTPLLDSLYDMLMLTDVEGILKGDENINVMGVRVALQRETQRARQLEFLQITANPMDAGIMGPKGRAKVLRSVSETIGIPGDGLIPDDEELEAQQEAERQAAMRAQGEENMPGNARKAQGGQAPKGGNVTNDQGPRVNITGGNQ
jgi:hypothetical protein